MYEIQIHFSKRKAYNALYEINDWNCTKDDKNK